MTNLAIKVEAIKNLDLFKMNCAALGFNYDTAGLIEHNAYIYFNLKEGNKNDLKEGYYWGAAIGDSVPVVHTEDELYCYIAAHNLDENLDPIKMVAEFHEAFGVKNNNHPTMILDWDLRRKLAQEELDEYVEACKDDNKVEILDSLIDQAYILFGSILRHGMADIFFPAFQEVHASNMSKLDENGKPIINDGIIDPNKPVGKILKSDRFREPDLKKFIE